MFPDKDEFDKFFKCIIPYPTLQQLIQRFPIHPIVSGKFGIRNPNFDGFIPTKIDADSTRTFHTLDCEMVQMKNGRNEVGRVSLVNHKGEVTFDVVVKPDGEIKDYVTKYSGLTKDIIDNATHSLKDVQDLFIKTVKSTDILIGHALENDLIALRISHPNIIDTQIAYALGDDRPQSLKYLTEKHLNRKIQTGEHSSVEDAIATLDLARKYMESNKDGETKKPFQVVPEHRQDFRNRNNNNIYQYNQDNSKSLKIGIHNQHYNQGNHNGVNYESYVTPLLPNDLSVFPPPTMGYNPAPVPFQNFVPVYPQIPISFQPLPPPSNPILYDPNFVQYTQDVNQKFQQMHYYHPNYNNQLQPQNLLNNTNYPSNVTPSYVHQNQGTPLQNYSEPQVHAGEQEGISLNEEMIKVFAEEDEALSDTSTQVDVREYIYDKIEDNFNSLNDIQVLSDEEHFYNVQLNNLMESVFRLSGAYDL